MKPNVGGFDRTWRLVLGPVILGVSLFAPLDITWRIGLGLWGVVMTSTGLFNF